MKHSETCRRLQRLLSSLSLGSEMNLLVHRHLLKHLRVDSDQAKNLPFNLALPKGIAPRDLCENCKLSSEKRQGKMVASYFTIKGRLNIFNRGRRWQVSMNRDRRRTLLHEHLVCISIARSQQLSNNRIAASNASNMLQRNLVLTFREFIEYR